MRLLIISMLYVLCGSGLTAARNEIFFRKLGNPKEAYGDEVHQILIDRDGYAWIITIDRLLRFDGKNMKQYGGLKVERLAIDSCGVMYASGPNCLLRHDRMNDMFDSVPQWSAALNDNNGHPGWQLPGRRSQGQSPGRASSRVAHPRRQILIHT